MFGKAIMSAFWQSEATLCPPLLLNDEGPLPQRSVRYCSAFRVFRGLICELLQLTLELPQLLFLLIDDRNGRELPFAVAALKKLEGIHMTS